MLYVLLAVLVTCRVCCRAIVLLGLGLGYPRAARAWAAGAILRHLAPGAASKGRLGLGASWAMRHLVAALLSDLGLFSHPLGGHLTLCVYDRNCQHFKVFKENLLFISEQLTPKLY